MVLGRSFLLVSVLLGGALAGCVASPEGTVEEGPSTSDPAATSPGIEESHAPLPSEAPVPAGTGSLQGQVLDTDGVWIKDASVLLVGTSNYTKTDSQGRFAIHGITPGTYTLHVDADKFKSLENETTILAQTITSVVVHLEPNEAVLGFRQHFHDLWDGKPTKVIHDKDVDFPWGPATGGTTSPTHHCQNFTTPNLPLRAFAASADDDADYKPTPWRCFAADVLFEKTVPPGTTQLNVTVTWRQSALVAADVTLDYLDANDDVVGNGAELPPGSNNQRGKLGPHVNNGETKSVPVNAGGADNGHANFTQWMLRLLVNSSVGGVPLQSGDLIRSQLDPFHVTVVAVRGIIPPEKPHNHYWLNGARSRIYNGTDGQGNPDFANASSPAYERDPATRFRNASYGDPQIPNIMLPPGKIIPPGTTRLNVWLNYTYNSPAGSAVNPVPSQKVLLFRTAAINPVLVGFGDLKEVPGTETPGSVFYSFPVGPDESDKFYQWRSLWLFLLTNKGRNDDPNFINECGTTALGLLPTPCETQYMLTVDAINENWADDFKAGRI